MKKEEKESKSKMKEYLEDLKKNLIAKQKKCDELKEPIAILTEAISDPPYRCKDEKIVKSYADFVNKTFRSSARSYKIWKSIIGQLDRDVCIALTNYTIYFLRECGNFKPRNKFSKFI